MTDGSFDDLRTAWRAVPPATPHAANAVSRAADARGLAAAVRRRAAAGLAFEVATGAISVLAVLGFAWIAIERASAIHAIAAIAFAFNAAILIRTRLGRRLETARAHGVGGDAYVDATRADLDRHARFIDRVALSVPVLALTAAATLALAAVEALTIAGASMLAAVWIASAVGTRVWIGAERARLDRLRAALDALRADDGMVSWNERGG